MCRLKKHAYAGLPPSENHVSQGKNMHTNTRNSAFPRALETLQSREMYVHLETLHSREMYVCRETLHSREMYVCLETLDS